MLLVPINQHQPVLHQALPVHQPLPQVGVHDKGDTVVLGCVSERNMEDKREAVSFTWWEPFFQSISLA